MLVLSRKTDEEIVFPALGVTIRVMQVRGKAVKLGIEAPRSLEIVRGELLGYAELMDRLRTIGQQINHHGMRGQLNSALLSLELVTASISRGVAVDEPAIVNGVIRQLELLDSALRSQAHPLVTPGISVTGSIRLLVVDDNRNERELLKSVLAIQGFRVDTATDGADAIQQLNQGALPNAVLLDMQMPKLCGAKTLRCIRSDTRMNKLRVIGVSGNESQEIEMPDGLAGFDGWFNKPLDLGRLINLIQTSTNFVGSSN